MTKVLFSVPIKDYQLEEFKRNFPQVEFMVEKEQSREKLLPLADIWVTYGFDIKEGEIEDADNLKWIMAYSAGVDKLPAIEIIKKNILVTNVSGIHRHAIAEQVFTYMLYHVRKFSELCKQQKNGEWNRRIKADSLYGKTIGIIGVGAIGKEIARKAKAFDMKVLGVRRSGEKTDFVDEIFPMEGFHRVLGESDYVVMVLPLTSETKHIMDREAFRAMKENSYFINIARGEVVDTKALIWALKENIIGGAGLDVFEEEPLPKDHPLRYLENVLITPHVAGIFPGYIARANEILNHNLGVYIENAGEMINIVNIKRGY
jgi:phosphoglycerate dehydrogenase-like enzyme